MRCGEIWDIEFPFKDQPDERKRRPVVVVGWSPVGRDEDATVLVVPITSYGDGGRVRNGDLQIHDPAGCGLTKRSYIRTRRLWSADPRAFRNSRCRGRITEEDFKLILLAVNDLFHNYQ